MSNIVIVGLQWGDEGKGKIVDLLCPAFDAVVRYQGGNNAGHTVKFGDRHFALRLIPSGILHAGLPCVMGNGLVVAPDALLEELAELAAAGVETAGRLFVSNRAQAVLPQLVALDRAREAAAGEQKVGTTGRGIGPTYEMKVARLGLRLSELGSPQLEDRLRAQLVRVEAELAALGGEPLGQPGPIADLCREWSRQLAPYLADTEHLLHRWVEEGRSLLFEGAQGSLLDVDHGTYPFVTSSSPTAGGASTGTGVPPTALDGVLGIVKAYTTRVGGGPFPGELTDERGEFLRRRGHEFGTVTGRPRRCGWFDAVAVRYAVRLNGTRAVALTKLDVLDTLDEIPVCVGYRHRGGVLQEFPSCLETLAEVEPVYETLPGWQSDTCGVLDFARLPAAARRYVEFLERAIGSQVALISTGPRREETIVRDATALTGWLGDRMADVLAARGA
ncbi:MAG: adenylosuccinate synthase [Thermoanaerobaculia bacterium]|nr:adenylosuccinate synthase [Thermoanaerobaculia bacterium]